MNRDHESYRSRVQDIRSEARSLIERLRSERLAKSRFAPKPEAPASLPVPSKAEIDAWTGGSSATLVSVPEVLSAAAVPAVAVQRPALALKAKAARSGIATDKAAISMMSASKIAAHSMPPSAAPAVAPPTPLAEPAPDSIKIKAPAKAKSARSGQAKAMTERKAVSAAVQVSADPASAFQSSSATSAPVEMTPVTMPVTARAKTKKTAKSAVAAEKLPAVMASMPPVSPGKAAAPGRGGHKKPGLVAAVPHANKPEITTAEPMPPKPVPSVPHMTAKPARVTVKTSAKRESVHPEKPGHSAAAPSVSLLPGIGPGLVWRLEQSGYRTLEDVANARTEDLAAKLGAVGKLVKLDRWIDFAKQAIAA